MKFTFILITFLINFLNPLYIKSEEKIDFSNIKQGSNAKEESLNNKNNKLNKIHIVKEGDTILSISKFYKIDKNLIIKLNELKDKNYIYIGQNLIISNDYQNSKEQRYLKNQTRNSYHIVQAGENLTEISNKYKLKLESLIEINNLNNPDSIKVGRKLLLNTINPIKGETSLQLKDYKINELKNIDQKTYGPLIIQSKALEKENGRKILNVINQSNKKLILSIRCETREIDVRRPRREWRGWKPAKEEFEKKLINDFC